MNKFQQIIDSKARNDIKNLNNKIKEETNPYKKMKMIEQTMMCQLFSGEVGGNVRFRNPW